MDGWRFSGLNRHFEEEHQLKYLVQITATLTKPVQCHTAYFCLANAQNSTFCLKHNHIQAIGDLTCRIFVFLLNHDSQ